MKELLVFLEDELAPRGINLHILTGICAGTYRPNGQTIADKMLFMVAAMAAEMERDLISERTNEGLDAARAAGRVGGRPAAVTDDVLAAARARRARGQSVTQIARELGVGRSTLYRALEDDEPGQHTPTHERAGQEAGNDPHSDAIVVAMADDGRGVPGRPDPGHARAVPERGGRRQRTHPPTSHRDEDNMSGCGSADARRIP
jgi:hypothetical protein